MSIEERKVFFHYNFQEEFFPDMGATVGCLRIQSPFARVRRILQMIGPLEDCIKRRVKVCTFIQKPLGEDPHLEESRALLRSIGVHVNLRPLIHEKIATCDDRILWDGSLNILSHYNTNERMTRLVSRDEVRKAIEQHGLDTCEECALLSGKSELSSIARSIARQRNRLGWSQRDLAGRSGVCQSVIAQVEQDKQNITMETLEQILSSLGLNLMCPQSYLAATIEEMMAQDISVRIL